MWGFSYWVFPVISAVVWAGMLIAMLITWAVEGKPHYASMGSSQNIAYISDIGADKLKPLFITGSCITTLFLDVAFLSDRWLRHRGRLDPNTTTAEKVLSGFAIFFAAIGTAGLILLSIFDTLRYPKLHDVFLLLFIAGYVVSAIFSCAEYQRLGIHFRQHRYLRISFWIKLFFILIEIVFAIIFIATNFETIYNVAAVFEWIVAFVFTFYILSFFVDLIPATRGRHYASKQTAVEMERDDPASRQHEAVEDGRYHGHGANNGVQSRPVGSNF